MVDRKVSRSAVVAAADRAEQRSRGQYQTRREAAARRSASEAYERAVARSEGKALPAAPPEPEPAPSLGKKVQVMVKARKAGVTAAQTQREVARLTEEIGKVADQAQALTRDGKYEEAAPLRSLAKKLAADRAEITKRNRKK